MTVTVVKKQVVGDAQPRADKSDLIKRVRAMAAGDLMFDYPDMSFAQALARVSDDSGQPCNQLHASAMRLTQQTTQSQ